MSNYASSGDKRVAAAKSKVRTSMSTQETYKDFSGGAQSTNESGYAGNQIPKESNYKIPSSKTTKINPYLDY